MTAATTLVIKRTFSTPCERLFAMWTTEELIKQWFCPGKDMTVPIAEIDSREGGSYRIVMHGADGTTYSPSGVYEKVVANEQLVFSWKWADSELVTRVTLDFRALNEDETELTLTHEGFPDSAVRDSHNQGWDGCLSRLANTF
jgi:glutathione S-transferase